MKIDQFGSKVNMWKYSGDCITKRILKQQIISQRMGTWVSYLVNKAVILLLHKNVEFRELVSGYRLPWRKSSLCYGICTISNLQLCHFCS